MKKRESSFLRSFRIVATPELEPLVRALLESEGFCFEPEPFSPVCWRLTHEPFPLGSSLACFFGYVYIQDRSSMLPPLALAPQKGACVLDMCSSPGSKSGFAAQLTGPEGFVLANEISGKRLATLRQNMRVINAMQVGTCGHDGTTLNLRAHSIPCILLDPPCSAWGTTERNPRVTAIWRDSKLPPLIATQRALLRHAATLLAPGGTLVYSTCTTNSAENEEQVRFAEDKLGLCRDPLTPFPGFFWDDKAGSEGTLRVDGERSKAQGFYIARLKKPKATATPEDAGAAASVNGSAAVPGSALSRTMLASATVDPDAIPAGRLGVFKDGVVRFIPHTADAMLPHDFVWQAAPLGVMRDGAFWADARLRLFMKPSGPALVLEKPHEVRQLLSGTAMKADLPGKEAGLWLGELPLGRVGLRSGRVICAFGR